MKTTKKEIVKRIELIDRVVALMKKANYLPCAENDYWAITKNVAKYCPDPTDEDIANEIEIFYNA